MNMIVIGFAIAGDGCAAMRMNYLHAWYRKAGKMLDRNLLHTLGDWALEIPTLSIATDWHTCAVSKSAQ